MRLDDAPSARRHLTWARVASYPFTEIGQDLVGEHPRGADVVDGQGYAVAHYDFTNRRPAAGSCALTLQFESMIWIGRSPDVSSWSIR